MDWIEEKKNQCFNQNKRFRGTEGMSFWWTLSAFLLTEEKKNHSFQSQIKQNT